MFGNIGFTEIMMLMVVFLLVFGAKRLRGGTPEDRDTIG